MRGLHADGDAIRTFRKLRGLTQEDLAEHAGLDVKTVRNAEAGRSLDLATLRAVAAALGVELFGIVRRNVASRETEEANMLTVSLAQDAFHRRDLEEAVAFYREDAILRFVIPGGERDGIDAIRDFFEEAFATFQADPLRPEDIRLHAADDYVFLRTRSSATIRATGVRFTSDQSHEYRLEDGRIVSHVGFFDSKAIMDSFESPDAS